MNWNGYRSTWCYFTLVCCLYISCGPGARPAEAGLFDRLLRNLASPSPRQPKPMKIPAGPDAPTSKIYTDAERALSQRQIIDAYKSVGKRDPAWDKTAIDLLTRSAGAVTHSSEDARPAKLTELGKAAVDAGCDDPMVLFWYAVSLERSKRRDEALALWPKVMEAFETSEYGPSYVTWTTGRYWSMLRKRNRFDQAEKIKPQLLDSLMQTIADDDFKPSEKRILLYYLDNMLKHFLPQERADFCKTFTDKYKTDKWVCHVIAGRAQVDLAWKARSGKWAHKVTEEGWKSFAEHLALARQHLTAAWKMDPTAPEPAQQMITVAMAGHAGPGETPRFWFDRAVSAQLDYLPAYKSLRWALRPRWGGSHEEIYQFGLECAATKRYDTWVPVDFFWAVHDVAKDMDGDWEQALARPGIYDGLQSMLDGYVQAKNSKSGKDWALSMKAAVAWRAGKFSDARKALDAVGDGLMSKAFKNVQGETGQAVDEIRAQTTRAALPTTRPATDASEIPGS